MREPGNRDNNLSDKGLESKKEASKKKSQKKSKELSQALRQNLLRRKKPEQN